MHGRQQVHREIELEWLCIHKHRMAWHAIFETHHETSLKAKLFLLFYLLFGKWILRSAPHTG
jgi:hypothetical protein